MSEKRLISSSVLFAAIEEELQNRHQASFTITGMSMWPFLCHERDKVIITSCAAADLKKAISYYCRPLWEIICCIV